MATYYSDYYKKPSYLYRLYSADGDLLYVGMTLNPLGRIPTHKRKAWGKSIASCTTERFPDRESAKAAERSAIHHEKPRYNLTRPRLECC